MEKPDMDAMAAALRQLFTKHIEAYTQKHGHAPPCIYVTPKLRRLFVNYDYEYEGIPLLAAEGINSATLCSPAPYLPDEPWGPFTNDDQPDPLFGREGDRPPGARWQWRDFPLK